MSSSPTIFRSWLTLQLLLLASCKQTQKDPYQELVTGQISYPFPSQEERLGKDPAEDRFVIRSVKGASEYIVEIPYAAEDYNIAVPMQGMAGGPQRKDPKNPQLTDRELLSAMPRPDQEQEKERALLEEALGVGAAEGPEQGPSYSLGLAKVVELYKSRQYEYALIEINQLLAYYPQAARLHKMKGTILLKSGELALAEKSWIRALELDPRDKSLSRGIERIRRRLELQRKTPEAPSNERSQLRRRPATRLE